jgi:hypothetical protein
MNRVPMLSVVVLLLTVVGVATVADAFPVCIGLRHEVVTVPNLKLYLIATPAGPFAQLTGQAVFAEPNVPDGASIVHAVSGTAMSTADGVVISLTGAGIDQTQTVRDGIFAIQLGGDPTRNRLTYARRNVDGTSTTVVTGVAEFVVCPPSVAGAG